MIPKAHRAGAVEIWGRGTNRVIEECKRYGIAPPTFDDWGGSLVVTFRAQIIPGAGAESRDQVGTKSALSRHQVGAKSALSEDQVRVLRLCRQEQPLIAMMNLVGRSDRTKFRDGLVKPLLEAGLLELTIPDKPQSRLQKYRLTEEGAKALKTKRE